MIPLEHLVFLTRSVVSILNEEQSKRSPEYKTGLTVCQYTDDGKKLDFDIFSTFVTITRRSLRAINDPTYTNINMSISNVVSSVYRIFITLKKTTTNIRQPKLLEEI